MSDRNGKPLPPPPPQDPMLKAVGEVVGKELRKRDEVITALHKQLEEVQDKTKVEIKNHVDLSPLANGMILFGDKVGQALELKRPPDISVAAPSVRVEAPSVNFDLTALTKQLAAVVEHSLDQPIPSVNFPVDRLEAILREALSAPTMPEVRVDLSQLTRALESLADGHRRNTEALESVAALLQLLSAKVGRLETSINTPRQPRRLKIVHDDGAETRVEEV